MLHLSLSTVKYILNKFETYLDCYSIKTHYIDQLQKVILIEDSLALYVGIIKSQSPVCSNVEAMFAWTRQTEFMDMPASGNDYYELYIEEVTYNSLGFKYNHSKFIREMESITSIQNLSLNVSYLKFKGLTRLYWCQEKETLLEKVDRLLPEMKLRDRYENWDGVNYYFIVLEMEGVSGNHEYAVAYTNQKPHNYVNSKGREWIKNGIQDGVNIRTYRRNFYRAFDSWKGKSKQYRLENHLKYFY
ncbi:hypothetical protein AZ66_20385, partial [Paenibacillus sp. E194]|uniref:hypothetical protein n=1 Tax=Paenibacillus sp. E194 TaxID=1458845 RepID=UPI0005C9081D